MDLLNGDVKKMNFYVISRKLSDFKDYLNKKISIAVGAMGKWS